VKVDGRPYRTIWLNQDGSSVDVIDQRWLPHEFKVATLRNVAEAATAIRDMWVRGAPLIGATAAYGLALAMREDPTDAALDVAHEKLAAAQVKRFGLELVVVQRTLLALANFQDLSAVEIAVCDPYFAAPSLGDDPDRFSCSIHFLSVNFTSRRRPASRRTCW